MTPQETSGFISLSKEHANYLPEVEECFKDTGFSIDANYMRCSMGDLPMQIMIFLGSTILSGVIYDVIKSGVISFFDKFKDGRVVINAKGVWFSIHEDNTINVVVVESRQKEFEHIKTLEDVIDYLQGKSEISGWMKTTLGEVTEIQSGSTPSTKEEAFWGGEIPWITPKDLSNHNSVYISEGERNITEGGLKNSSAQLLPKNTILFSSRAPIGYVAIANNEITTNQGFKNIVCDEVKSHFKFFYYLLKEKADHIEKLSSGSTFSEASASLMRSIKISLPPLSEQVAIASILSSFDDKIELLREENKTLEQIGQTIFQEWFGKYGVDSSEELPEGWRVGKLGEICSLKSGFPFGGNDFLDKSNTKVLKIKDLKGNGIINMSDISYVKDEVKHQDRVQFFKLEQGNIVVAMSGNTTGKIGVIPIGENELFLNQRVGKFFLKDKKYTSFLYFFLMSGDYESKILNMGYGSAQPNINPTQIENINAIFPNNEVFDNFFSLADPFFNKILENNSQIQSLSQTRDKLLSRLMRGEVRVF